MTQEEKAKAFDEALDRCKEWASGTCEQSINNSPKDIAEFIFPELKESEDERIRKSIIHILQVGGYMLPEERDKAIAYLEKQKEQKLAEHLPKEKVFDIMHNLTALSYSERIPINSDEYEWIHKITEDVRSLLDYPIEQKPAEKQDYSGLNDLERAIHRGFLAAGVENVSVTIIKETAKECLAQMESAEWSEEDEENISTLIEVVHERMGLSEKRKQYYEKWLKSLRPHKNSPIMVDADQLLKILPQPSWKPSEKQMEVFIKATPVNLMPDELRIYHSLYNDLKKLM